MNDTKEIKILFSDGSIDSCAIDVSRVEPWKIILRQSRLGTLESEAPNLCEALSLLRKQLESQSCQLLCNGSRRNVIVSGMSRQMSGGRKAYVVNLGEPASRESIVDIFDYAGPNEVSSIKDQQEFYKRWVDSLKND